MKFCNCNYINHNYRPQRSWGKGYIFTGVCDSVHRGVCLLRGGGLLWGDLLPGECLLWGVYSGGGGVPGPDGCLVETPRGTATAAGGMHPTGMHSCSI